MISTAMIIKQLMKKKGISNAELLKKINKIEEASGVRERTTKQNVTNYLNGYHNLGYDMARKMELALDLEDKTILNLMPKPKGMGKRNQYNECLKKWKRV